MSSLNKFTDCKNSATHSKFIPVKGFAKCYLPESYQDKDIVDFLMALADLTVKITVNFTSPNRPEVFPDTDVPYPYNDMWGSGKDRIASGWVELIRKHSGDENMECPCLKCKNSDTPSKVWGDVTVVTTTHNVFDRFEAEKATCRLFYDADDSPVVTIGGRGMAYSDVEGDRSALTSSTCDVELLEKLSSALQLCEETKSKIANKYKDPSHKLTMIVSHPHGCPKNFSFGVWLKKVEDSDSRPRYFYNTPACLGSGGAPVVILANIGKPSYLPHSGSFVG